MTPRLALMLQARRQYGELFPCAGKATLWDCFTVERHRLLFWFNDSTGSTRMLWTMAEKQLA